MNPEAMISHTEILIQLLLSAILGGLVGVERERKSGFAGLRTHMLVCMGSTLIMMVSQYGFENTLRSQLVVLDPSRMAAQVVSGIGFLGAGTILFLKNTIKGLTTAASLWAVAAVGLAIGGALYVAAILATMLILIVLAGVKSLEKSYFKHVEMQEVKFSSQHGISLVVLEELLVRLNLRSSLKDLQIENEEREVVHLIFKSNPQVNLMRLIDELKKLAGIEKVELID